MHAKQTLACVERIVTATSLVPHFNHYVNSLVKALFYFLYPFERPSGALLNKVGPSVLFEDGLVTEFAKFGALETKHGDKLL